MLTDSMAPLSARLINKALSEFQLQLTPEQVASIQRYMGMLLAWNENVNLTAIRDPLEMLYRHFCESMYAAAAVPLEAGESSQRGFRTGHSLFGVEILLAGPSSVPHPT